MVLNRSAESILKRRLSPNQRRSIEGMDGTSLWHAKVSCDGSGSPSWTSMSGATASKPVLTGSQSSGKLYLEVRGMDDRIWHSDYSSSWESWNALSTGATCDGPAATVLGCKLHVVVLGMDGNSLWYNCVDLITDNYSNWNWLSGATPSAPTLAGWT